MAKTIFDLGPHNYYGATIKLTFHLLNNTAPVKELVATRDGDGLGNFDAGEGTDERELLVLKRACWRDYLRREGGTKRGSEHVNTLILYRAKIIEICSLLSEPKLQK